MIRHRDTDHGILISAIFVGSDSSFNCLQLKLWGNWEGYWTASREENSTNWQRTKLVKISEIEDVQKRKNLVELLMMEGVHCSCIA